MLIYISLYFLLDFTLFQIRTFWTSSFGYVLKLYDGNSFHFYHRDYPVRVNIIILSKSPAVLNMIRMLRPLKECIQRPL